MTRLLRWLRHALELDHSPSVSVLSFVTRGYCDAFGVKYEGPRCPCKTCDRQWQNLDRPMTTGSSKWIRRNRRLAIYCRDGYRCVWCGTPVSLHNGPAQDGGGPYELATLDHVRPREYCGSNKTENLVTCCAACNAKRRHLLPYDFARRLAAELFTDMPVVAAVEVQVILARVLSAVTKPLAGNDARHIDRRQVAVVQRACTPAMHGKPTRKNRRRRQH